MNCGEAKQALMSHRPGIDAPNSDIHSAMETMRTDEALQTWFEGQQRFHAAMRDAFRDIAPPDDLKARILTEAKVARPLWRRREFMWSAAAAAIASAVGITLSMRPPAESHTFAAFQSRMVGFALREYRMDIETNSLPEVRAHLQSAGVPFAFPLPGPLANASVKGGAALAWKGEPVAMVCFNQSNAETLYLFVIRETDAFKAEPTNSTVDQFKGLAVAKWKRDGALFLLAGKATESEVRRLIESGA